MFQFMTLAKAMADENRVRILMALHAVDELCVCHINALLGLAPSTVSRHLFLLRNSRLLTARKDGRWMYYRLNKDAETPSLVMEALAWINKANSEDPRIKADRQRLMEILSGPDTACGP
jgi:DNA-binding transcriptional ArsR family regulator